MTSPRRGFRESVRDTRLKQDPEQLHARATQERVELGRYTPEQLAKHGVGVPPLWKTNGARTTGRSPLGMRAFQTMTRPPASCLWLATTTATDVIDSLHVEFVGDIARVSEAVDIVPGGATGREYILTLEPADQVIARCLDTAGLSDDDVPDDRRFRIRAWYQWEWTTDKKGRPQAQVVPDAQLRELTVKLERIPGAPLVVTEQQLTNAPDVPALPQAPSRADVLSMLETFFAAPA